nr:ribosomal protein L7Ae/L30e/S12e/Gadd45 [Tanacetum cinerariifolium]
MTKAKENALSVEIQIISLEKVRNYQDIKIKWRLLEDFGVIATKMKRGRQMTKSVIWLKLPMSQILKIPYNGQTVFTNEWDLASLEYSHETEGPYCTDLYTPYDIRRLLELERVVVNRTIKSQTVTLNPNQILTKELSPDMKQWEELIQENVFGQGGHRDRLLACAAHMLYCVVAEERNNLVYFFVKRIECVRDTPTANLPYGMLLTRLYRYVMETYPHLDNGTYDIVERVMHPLALKQTRRPRSDRGKALLHPAKAESQGVIDRHHHNTWRHNREILNELKSNI